LKSEEIIDAGETGTIDGESAIAPRAKVDKLTFIANN
jgi:hypothetical protein